MSEITEAEVAAAVGVMMTASLGGGYGWNDYARDVLKAARSMSPELATLRTRAEAAEARVAELEAERDAMRGVMEAAIEEIKRLLCEITDPFFNSDSASSLLDRMRALTKADMAQRPSPSPRALEWAQAEAEKIEARERAKDAVVKAAKGWNAALTARQQLKANAELALAVAALTKAEGLDGSEALWIFQSPSIQWRCAGPGR